MRQVIEGKVYDTEKAEVLAHHTYGMPGDIYAVEEALYRTPNGAYFTAGEGGAATVYGHRTGDNEWSGGAGIQPIPADEAFYWLQHCGASDVLVEEFGDVLEQA